LIAFVITYLVLKNRLLKNRMTELVRVGVPHEFICFAIHVYPWSFPFRGGQLEEFVEEPDA